MQYEQTIAHKNQIDIVIFPFPAPEMRLVLNGMWLDFFTVFKFICVSRLSVRAMGLCTKTNTQNFVFFFFIWS